MIGVGALLVLALVISGVYLALADQNGVMDVGPRSSANSSQRPADVADQPRAESTPAPIPRTDGAKSFAIETATALFEWDTNTPIPLSDYTGRLLAVADPTGAESSGLVADVATYLPNASAWAELRTYLTRQWLEVTSATVPTTWADAAAESKEYGIAPGTIAYTITGVRHRAGVWDGRTVRSEHEVSFTVFVVCAPAYPTCHLLRISKLDDPLP